MRAAQISDYGGKDVVQITDSAPKPTIGSDQVLVEIAAAGVKLVLEIFTKAGSIMAGAAAVRFR